MKKTLESIKVETKVKRKFDKKHFQLKQKGEVKTQSEVVDYLLNKEKEK